MKPQPLFSTLLAISLLACGCATRDPAGPPLCQWMHEPVVQLDRYKSVQKRSDQREHVAVAVAISGGGHRAGNFAAGVLTGLESIEVDGKPFNLLREVDYFSTVSGGGFAAGSYITALHDHLASKHPASAFSFTTALADDVAAPGISPRRSLQLNYHGQLIRGILRLGALTDIDRGDMLESRLDGTVLGRDRRDSGKSLTLGDVFVPQTSSCEPRLPYWVANATVYENGAIFPFTPDILETYGITKYNHQLGEKDLTNNWYALPLAVGMKASASFPGAIPATTLESRIDHPRNPYVHLFDGGMADNLGIITALRLLEADPAPRKVLLVIDSYPGTTEPFSKRSGSPIVPQILSRSMVLSLDSARSRRNDLVRRIAAGTNGTNGVDVVYFDFETLLDSPGKGLKDYQDARKVRTSLHVKPEVQEQLLEQGRSAVRIRTPELQKLIQRFPSK